MTGRIEFFADVPSEKWVVVKKMRVDKDTGSLEIARFLASVHATLHNKMFQFIGRAFDIDRLDQIAAEIVGAEWNEKRKAWILKGRVGEDRIVKAMSELKSPKTTKKIKEVVKGKKSQELAKLYVGRRVLDLLGFPLEPDPKMIEKVIDERELMDA